MKTPGTAHGFVNGLCLGHLWDVVMWLCSSRRITSCRQVAPHGGIGGMWCWKATEKRAGITKYHVLRTPMADSHRSLAEALPFGLSYVLTGAPYQLLVHRLIGSGRLLPRFLGRQTTEPGIVSSLDVFQHGVQPDGRV